MVLRRVQIIIVFCLLYSCTIFSQDDADREISVKHQKRLEKALVKTFKTEEYRISTLELSDSVRLILDKPHLKGALGEIFISDTLSAYFIITSAKGRFDYFDFLLIYNNIYQIKYIEILEYRSDHGYQITNKKWLSQFYGKTACDLVYSKDVDAISGATLSVNGLKSSLSRLCKYLKKSE